MRINNALWNVPNKRALGLPSSEFIILGSRSGGIIRIQSMGNAETTICDETTISGQTEAKKVLYKHGKAQGKTDHNTAYRNYNRKAGKGVLSMKNCFQNSI